MRTNDDCIGKVQGMITNFVVKVAAATFAFFSLPVLFLRGVEMSPQGFIKAPRLINIQGLGFFSLSLLETDLEFISLYGYERKMEDRRLVFRYWQTAILIYNTLRLVSY